MTNANAALAHMPVLRLRVYYAGFRVQEPEPHHQECKVQNLELKTQDSRLT